MCCCCSTIYSLLALHIQGSQLTLSNTHAYHHVETSEQACRPILLGLRHHVWDYSRDGSNLHHRRVRLASPGRRMRFAYVFDPGNFVGDKVESVDPDRANVPGTHFLYRGTFSARQFSDVLVPLQTGDPCRLTGAGQATRTSWSRFHGYLE